MKRLEIHLEILNVPKSDHIDIITKLICTELNINDENVTENISKYISKTFLPKYKEKWESCSRLNDYFLKKYNDWLNSEFILPDNIRINIPGIMILD